VSVLPVVITAVMLLGYVAWGMQGRLDRLALRNAQLALENSAYEQAADQLSAHMITLRATIADLELRNYPDPALDSTVNLLLDGTNSAVEGSAQDQLNAAGRTLDRLDALLGTIDGALHGVRKGVAFREAAADATPTIWPADGWISAGYGYRTDPFTGERNFHPAVDISTYKGAPVYATGTGRVISASRNGAYGNLVELEHGFGLITRYGHLSEFSVAVGDTVVRGDVIGRVGNTGRATGHHVHYEVWVNGRTLNPRKLLTDSRTVAAN
jgi:murein DD-endopeptidase MepM/ murein hydrolase activator NlpD